MSHMTFLCSDSEDADPEERPSLVSLRQAAEQARATLGIQTTEAASIESAPKQGEESGRKRLVAVDRSTEVDEARSQLPIIGMEQEIVESVLENDVVVLSGETGCGKTTQASIFPTLHSILAEAYIWRRSGDCI